MENPESNQQLERDGGEATRISLGNEFQLGQLIAGRYEVLSRLGEGGMGLVYRVNHILLNKEFALKTIDKSRISAMAIRRFQQEARTTFALDHPNIIAVNDFGLWEDQTPFLVMELLNGETLGERIKRAGCLTLEQAVPVFVQVCFGLAYAHECGIVHRDIKPSNIMISNKLALGAEGSVKILDFGIAKFTGHEEGEIQALTRTGEIFGSPLYMSPEQCTGLKVDHRADVYALGCVLFEALTGNSPFMGDTALSTMLKHQGEKAPTLKEASLGGEFPQAIEDIVATMLAKEPESRYQNLGIVAHDLGALKRGASISINAKQSSEPAKSKATAISISRNKLYASLFGIVLLMAFAGFLGYMLHDFQSHKPVTLAVNARPEESSTSMLTEIPKVRFIDKGPSPTDGERESSRQKPKRELLSGSAPDVVATTPDELDRPVMKETELKELLAHHREPNHFALGPENLSSNKLFELIANASWIHTLVLHDCTIDNESLGKLSKLNLKKICLDRSNFNDIGAARLSSCDIGIVSVNGTQLTDEGVAKLAKIKKLGTLSLSDTGITDNGIRELAKAKHLLDLDLKRSSQITSLGLAPLARTHLRSVTLDTTPIDDAGIAYLAKIDTLKEVILNSTKVTIKGIEEFCRDSKSCKLIYVQKCANLGPKEILKLRSEFPAVTFIDKDPKEGREKDY